MNPKYAFYIWTSYALTALVLAWNLFNPIIRRKTLIEKITMQNADSESDE